jgi:hypothetical protein
VEPSGSAGAGEAAPARQSSADPHPADVDVDVGALVGEKTEDDVGAEAMVQDQGCYHGWPTYFRYKRCDGWCDRVTTDLACVRPCNERLDHFWITIQAPICAQSAAPENRSCPRPAMKSTMRRMVCIMGGRGWAAAALIPSSRVRVFPGRSSCASIPSAG